MKRTLHSFREQMNLKRVRFHPSHASLSTPIGSPIGNVTHGLPATTNPTSTQNTLSESNGPPGTSTNSPTPNVAQSGSAMSRNDGRPVTMSRQRRTVSPIKKIRTFLSRFHIKTADTAAVTPSVSELAATAGIESRVFMAGHSSQESMTAARGVDAIQRVQVPQSNAPTHELSPYLQNIDTPQPHLTTSSIRQAQAFLSWLIGKRPFYSLPFVSLPNNITLSHISPELNTPVIQECPTESLDTPMDPASWQGPTCSSLLHWLQNNPTVATSVSNIDISAVETTTVLDCRQILQMCPELTTFRIRVNTNVKPDDPLLESDLSSKRNLNLLEIICDGVTHRVLKDILNEFKHLANIGTLSIVCVNGVASVLNGLPPNLDMDQITVRLLKKREGELAVQILKPMGFTPVSGEDLGVGFISLQFERSSSGSLIIAFGPGGMFWFKQKSSKIRSRPGAISDKNTAPSGNVLGTKPRLFTPRKRSRLNR